MPKLNMGAIDYSTLPRDIRGQYLSRMIDEQRKYWWIAFFVGGFLFLLSAVM